MGALNEQDLARMDGKTADTSDLLEEEKPVQVTCGTTAGERLTGVFILRPLNSLEDRRAVARAKAILAGGLSFGALDAQDQALFDAMARCEVMFGRQPDDGDKKERAPDWWYKRDPRKLGDYLVLKLSAMGYEHETAFFRSDGPEGAGAPGRCFVDVAVVGGGGDTPKA